MTDSCRHGKDIGPRSSVRVVSTIRTHPPHQESARCPEHDLWFAGQSLCHVVGFKSYSQVDEFLHADLLCASVEEFFGKYLFCLFWLPLMNQLAKAVAQCLAAHTERILDQGAQVFFFAWQLLDIVAHHLDDSALNLRWRVEDMVAHGEAIFDVVPYLNQYRQDAVGL